MSTRARLQRLTTLGITALICLPVAILASSETVPWLVRPARLAGPAALPEGDQELAWLHTSTNGPTWERFVAGLVRAQLEMPDLIVDDAGAFRDSAGRAPEVVVRRAGVPGSLRVRWYKVTGDATPAYWIDALSKREPAPLAVVGGGSSDRAVELAQLLDRRAEWRGARPLLLLTTATADTFQPDGADGADSGGVQPKGVVDVYDDRTFRFCFTNARMAEAVTEYARLAFDDKTPGALPPAVVSVVWEDDPFSTDLHERFGDAVRRGRGRLESLTWPVKTSIGGQTRPNFSESQVAEDIVKHLRGLPKEQRVILVLPTVTNPARRLLRAVLTAEPALRGRLVAVTGDGIPANAVTRDADFAWPVDALAVPLVLFCHNDPAAWDAPGGRLSGTNYELKPPNATEEVRHFADAARHVFGCCFEGGALLADPAELARRLHALSPRLFDGNGERLAGTGEFVCVLRPGPPPELEVVRKRGAAWERVRGVPIDRPAPAAPEAGGGP